MFNKKLLAAALLVTIAGSAQAADTAAQANVKWLGLVNSTTDGEVLKITGAGGGEVANGTISVESDASFTSTSVVVEARYLEDDAGSSYVANELAQAQWTFNNITYIVDGNIIDPSLITVTDLYSGDVVVDNNTAGKELGTVGVVADTEALNLQPELDASTLGLEAVSSASLQVSLSAQLAI
ncbi:hypothetical protein RC083_06790 [Pseudoalteromonas haloplanktis]|uniref:Uncharacterized protein n=1 Tax=Pseudoalteromonas haloplanktis TaxID=228 RepID=A0ABU1BAP0_PSEHA|nr:hypothetical protein [Pseudoalteromonas haloplanktis]MDQ9091297.1 hypothetical protein [Pseudoalteromonas haloplanktis]